MEPFAQLQRLGQSVWYDNLHRRLVRTGRLTYYRDRLAVAGVTSNPTIFDHAITGSHDYDDAIRASVCAGNRDPEAVFLDLAVEDIREAADVLRPVYDRTNGRDGYACLEVSPRLARETDQTIEEAHRLWARLERPNVMIKVPGTPAGIPAIEQLTADGINVNVTLLFSPKQWRGASEAWLRGLERRLATGRSLDVHSVASLFVSRIDRAANVRLPRSWRNRAGVACAGVVYLSWLYQRDDERWQRLAAAGAEPQRLLWASTSTKDPALDETYYVDALATPNTIVTLPERTLHAAARDEQVGAGLSPILRDAERIVSDLAEEGVDLERVGAYLQEDGVVSFDDSYTELLDTLQAKMDRLEGASLDAAPRPRRTDEEYAI